MNVVNLNTDSYDPDEYRIKPEPRTFDVWLSSGGWMYPIVEGECFANAGAWERITVQEVLK